MLIYLGLGSNQGDRRGNIRAGIQRLEGNSVRVLREAPLMETPALLPQCSPGAWNRPFLNTVLECEAAMEPRALREKVREIERELGGEKESRWAPRAIDIDILIWGDQQIDEPDIRLPYPELECRSFVLSPLVHLRPELKLPGFGDRTVLELSTELAHHIPLWMGIVNVTPDSFSDGGRYTDRSAVDTHLGQMIEAGVHIIDVGAESTRPGATPVPPDEEWARLESVLDVLGPKLEGLRPRPLVSVDTRNPHVAEKSLDWGADVINDVTGLGNPAMLELAAAADCDWIAMHSVTVPADRDRILSTSRSAFDQVHEWLEARKESWSRAGLDLARIIFDPGIGFGKDALQSLELLRNAARFRRHGLRVLVGHSRKSFMASFSDVEAKQRDLMTIGASLQLCRQGVDVIRVHDVVGHLSAYLGWAHLQETTL